MQKREKKVMHGEIPWGNLELETATIMVRDSWKCVATTICALQTPISGKNLHTEILGNRQMARNAT